MSDDEEVKLYAGNPAWADVVPIAQYENVDPVAPIFYTPEYKDATDYFRGILKTGETSPRVLELTERIIRMNPAHYTAWQYRYKTLLALSADLSAELALMDGLALAFMKTYQVWHHRRLLLGALPPSTAPGAAHAELAFTARTLAQDAKNYHTWSHRQWVLARFGAWAGERAYAEALLEQDVRNNSAWHHRWFVVWAAGVREGDEDRERVRKRELVFVKEKIALAPNNPSAWNYLRGVLEHTGTPLADVRAFVLPYTVSGAPVRAKGDGEEEVVDLDDPRPTEGAELPAVPALEFLADIYTREGAVEKAVEIWRNLADERDTVRKRYWEFRIKEAQANPAA